MPQKNLLIIIIAIILTAIIAGGVVYFWQASSFAKEKQQLQQMIQGLNNQKEACEEEKSYHSKDECICSGQWLDLSIYPSPAEVPPSYMFVCRSVDNTADWQTYRNEAYGFEFKIPSSFKEQATGPAQIWLAEDESSLILNVTEEKFDPKKDIMTPGGPIKPQKISIGNNIAAYSYIAGDAQFIWDYIIIPKGNISIELSFETISAVAKADKVLNYKDQILSTFKFIE